ncbi:MAG: Rnase Y domain-containing protein, partial [Flavobacteriaceae bacterium]
MEPYIPIIVTAAIGLIVGFVVAKIIEKSSASQALNSAKRAAEGILKEAKVDAETMKKEKILQAKEKFIELKAEHEKVILSRDKKMAEAEK